jgi:hypothetical protein
MMHLFISRRIENPVNFSMWQFLAVAICIEYHSPSMKHGALERRLCERRRLSFVICFGESWDFISERSRAPAADHELNGTVLIDLTILKALFSVDLVNRAG